MGSNTLTEQKQNIKKVVECSTVTWQVPLLLNGGGMPNQHELIKCHTESLLCFSGRDLDLTFQTRMRHLVIARWHSARFSVSFSPLCIAIKTVLQRLFYP